MTLVPVPTELPSWVSEMVHKMLAPPAEELGELGRDLIKYSRARLQLRYFELLRERCEKAHIKISHVKLPLLAEILQKGMLEEDANLQTLWANLLANAADSRKQVLIRTAFPQILAEISKEEALYLLEMYEVRKKTVDYMPNPFKSGDEFFDPEDVAAQEPPPKLDDVSYDNLVRLRLIEPNDETLPVEPLDAGEEQYKFLTTENYLLTALGEAFIVACHAPKAS